MKVYEYFDLGSDVFMKVHDGDNIVESLKKPKNEWPNVVINRFKGQKSYKISEEEQNEDMETIAAMEANGESPTYDIASVDNLIVTESGNNISSTDESVHIEVPNGNTVDIYDDHIDIKGENIDLNEIAKNGTLYGDPEDSDKKLVSSIDEDSRTPLDLLEKPNKDFNPKSLGLEIIKEENPSKKESKKKKSKKENYDFVSHPSHYNGHKLLAKVGEKEEKVEVVYETIDFLDSTARRMEKVMYGDELHSYLDTGKYYDRAGEKPEEGKTVRYKMYEDIKKQIWYLTHCAELIEKNGFEDKE